MASQCYNLDGISTPTSSDMVSTVDTTGNGVHFDSPTASPSTEISLGDSCSHSDVSSIDDIGKLMFGIVDDFKLNPLARNFVPKEISDQPLSPPVVFGYHNPYNAEQKAAATPEPPKPFRDPFSQPIPVTGTSLGHLLILPAHCFKQLSYKLHQFNWVFDKNPVMEWPSFVANFLRYLLQHSVPDYQTRQFAQFLGNSEWHTHTAKRVLDVQVLGIQSPVFRLAFAINEQFIAVEKDINRASRFLDECPGSLSIAGRVWGLRKALKISPGDEITMAEKFKALLIVSNTKNDSPDLRRARGPSNQAVVRAIVDRVIPARSPPPSALFSPSISMEQAIVSRSLNAILPNAPTNFGNMSPALAMNMCLHCGTLYNAMCRCRLCLRCKSIHPPGACGGVSRRA